MSERKRANFETKKVLAARRVIFLGFEVAVLHANGASCTANNKDEIAMNFISST